MANPASYRPRTGEIPVEPGVYRFSDEHGRVIYVGKAKNLRARLTSYFANPAALRPKTYAMVHAATRVQWTIVGSELEALQLEYTWIKEFAPRYNLAFRDDKSYPYLAVTLGEKFPRVQVMRGERRKGTRYFGPYTAGAIRETVDTLLRVFPVRTCSAGVFRRAEQSGRPCLLGYIDKCSAPCVGRISPEDHRKLAERFCEFMSGQARRFIIELERQMSDAVAELDYERAARLRDDLTALRKVFERNAVVLNEETHADVFAVHHDQLEAAVQVFHVRSGRVRGQHGWVVEKVDDVEPSQLLEQLLQQVYGGTAEAQSAAESADRIPRQILVPELPDNAERLAEWLSGLRGARVEIRVPQRGEKAALMRTVATNAEQALKLHKSRRAGDLTQRSLALQELQEALDLPVPLLRIECYDISHIQGSNVVASMVVVEDGLPRKSEYRKFTITGDAAADDTASIYDVIFRRFRNYLAEQRRRAEDFSEHPGGFEIDPRAASGEDAGRPARFTYPPNLVVVDGGSPQVAAASRAMADVGINNVHVIGLAKRLEEIWLPGEEFPVILPRTSQGLYLLQRLRDEAHRFAISFHRSKRSKSMIYSVLDGVPGVGEVKRKALLRHFGSVKRLRDATVTEIAEVKGFGPLLAAVVHQHLAEAAGGGEAAEPSVNMTTGEIIESSLG